jgi:hypothetical protein
MKVEKKNVSIIRQHWLLASESLGFEIITPFKINHKGKDIMCFGFLPKYGSKKGMVIELTSPPYFETNKEIINACDENGLFFSFIDVQMFQNYDEDKFIEALKEWELK